MQQIEAGNKEATLYDKLKAIELFNESLKIPADKLNNFLKNYPDFLKQSGIKLLQAPGLSGKNILTLQKTIIGGYKTNPILLNAINNRKTIEKTLEELTTIHNGVKFFLPRRKNKAHNKKIEELGELVTCHEHLKTNGVFAFDNFVSAGGCSGTIAFGAAYCLYAYSNVFSNSSDVWMSAFVAMAIGAVIGLNANYSARTGSSPKIEARYLDRKTRLLFAGNSQDDLADSIWLIE